MSSDGGSAEVRPDEAKHGATTREREASTEKHRELAESIRGALESIDEELGTRTWPVRDPERRKALSRARSFLHRIREGLEAPTTSAPLEATRELVERAKLPATRYGRENAWDFAEELRVASYAFANDEALVQLLEKEAADRSSVSHVTVFGKPLPAELLSAFTADKRTRALAMLRRLHDERVDRVRHDRARDKLWQHFVWKLIPIVYALFALCLWMTSAPRPFLAIAAGAIGSMLSAVIKLREGEQRIRHLRRSASFLLLQPMVGAIAALVMTWIGVQNLLKLDTSSASSTATVVLGFLAGFSEPFFLGTIGRLAEMGSANGKKPDDAAPELRKKSHP